MGIGLNYLHQTEDPYRIEGNFIFDTDKEGVKHTIPLDQKVRRHMAKLTKYTMEKIENYGIQFILDKIIDNSDDLFEGQENELVELFGSRVVYPIHRNEIDFSGILTIEFPGISGMTLADRLAEKDYSVVSCLEGMRAIRISFDYRHKNEDIDNLFKKIQEVHWKYIEELLADNKITDHLVKTETRIGQLLH